GGNITQVDPGVLFYYTSVTVNAGQTVLIDQTITTGQSSVYLFAVQQAPATSQVIVYDKNCDKLNRQPSISFLNTNTDVQITGLSAGTYIISVKYSPNSIVGRSAPSPDTVHYDFKTYVDGTKVDQDPNGLNLVKKNFLVLGAPQATAPSGDVLTQQTLLNAVDQAVAQWQAAGIGAESLKTLRQLTFATENLEDNVLGYEAGKSIVVDTDAAGYGWSSGRVDLVATVRHELGHALGF